VHYEPRRRDDRRGSGGPKGDDDLNSSNNGDEPKITSVQAVLDVLTPGLELTDAEIVSRVIERLPNMHRSKVIPARIRLARKGTVELARKNDQGHQVWRLTPPGGEDAAREAAADRKARPEKVLQRYAKPERQAQVVATLLENDDVNRIVREQTERARKWRRARQRAQEIHAETETEKRERKRQLAEERRSDGPNLAFLKVRDQLRDSVNVLIDVRRFMQNEVEDHEAGQRTSISPERWHSVAVNLMEVMHVAGAVWHDLGAASSEPPEHCPLCGARTAADHRALDLGYIDADGVEILDADLISDEEGA
jgi:hypothetical protein